jgi:hypothetical protein
MLGIIRTNNWLLYQPWETPSLHSGGSQNQSLKKLSNCISDFWFLKVDSPLLKSKDQTPWIQSPSHIVFLYSSLLLIGTCTLTPPYFLRTYSAQFAAVLQDRNLGQGHTSTYTGWEIQDFQHNLWWKMLFVFQTFFTEKSGENFKSFSPLLSFL